MSYALTERDRSGAEKRRSVHDTLEQTMAAAEGGYGSFLVSTGPARVACGRSLTFVHSRSLPPAVAKTAQKMCRSWVGGHP